MVQVSASASSSVEEENYIHPGSCLGALADPIRLTRLIREFSIGNFEFGDDLIRIAKRSIADSIFIVSSPPVLERTEMDLKEGGRYGMGLLSGLLWSIDTTICTRLSERPRLLQELVYLVARQSRTIDFTIAASLVLNKLSTTVSTDAFVHTLESISDSDLRGLVSATGDYPVMEPTTLFLADCISRADAPLIKRLLDVAELPNAMNKLVLNDFGYVSAKTCIVRLAESTIKLSISISWIKPIIKTLRTAVLDYSSASASASASASTSSSSSNSVEHASFLLRKLSTIQDLNVKALIAIGIPDYISVLHRGDAVNFVILLGNLSTHPRAMSLLLEYDVITPLVSLLLPATYSAQNTTSYMRKAAAASFRTLGNLLIIGGESVRAPLLASSDLSRRLFNTLKHVIVPLLSEEEEDILVPVAAIYRIHYHRLISMEQLVITGAIARLQQLAMSSKELIQFEIIVGLITALKWEVAGTNMSAIFSACRRTFTVRAMIDIIIKHISTWTILPHEPKPYYMHHFLSGSAWIPDTRGTYLEEFLADTPSAFCEAILENPAAAFEEDLHHLQLSQESRVQMRAFQSGRVLHYLDVWSGPKVAARLSETVPQFLLLSVREAAAKGRWGRPLTDGG